MENVKIEMTLQEACDVVNMLGQLPTSSNAHGLWLKLRVQVEQMLPKQGPAVSESEP
jgi:hypothetical protein